MADEDEEIYENEEVIELRQEVENWKAKYKTLELKKRESDLSLNKIKTEINSLRSVDKLWKDSAKSVYHNLTDVKNQFDAQIDQIVGGLSGLTKAGERVSSKIPYNKKVKTVIAQLQSRIAQQEDTIMTLNSKIRLLSSELAEKTAKVERLSAGIEEEVERLLRPVRDKLADAMVMIMKEKAARAQERREIADLWPENKLMPSILMRYRAHSVEERERRVKATLEMNASFALAHEIRGNVFESKMWEIKYDDYGRPFYEHQKTGETNWEPPAIMSYKPPPGRDEMGNIIGTEENSLVNYDLKTDHRGEVYYVHKKTGEKTYTPPSAYKLIPRGKAKETIVSEAAQMVLAYIKEKVTKHIEQTKALQHALENPLTPEEVKKKEKEEKNKSIEDKTYEAELAAQQAAEDAAEPLDLSLYQYDIETVELLAGITEVAAKGDADKDPEEIRAAKRDFLVENDVRDFDPAYFVGRTIAEVDLTTITLQELRAIVEDLAMTEEKLEKRTERVRENMKDFSFVLMERIAEDEKQKALQARRELEERERERRAAQKQFMLDKQREANEKKEAQRKQFEEQQRLQAELLAANPPAEGAEGAENGEGGMNGDQDNTSQDPDPDRQQQQQQQQRQAIGGYAEDGLEDGSLATRESAFLEGGGGGAEGMPGSPGGDDQSLATGDNDNSTLADMDIGSEGGEHSPNRRKKKKNKRHTTRGGTSVLSGTQTGTEDTSHDGFSDDETQYNENGEAMDAEEDELYDPHAKSLINYGAILFGEPALDPTEPDFSPELVKLSTNLVNFALFCGYTNLHCSESPHDSSLEYSLRLDDVRGEHLESVKDDDFLSSAFFLTCTKERLDAIRNNTIQSYEANIGVLPIGPQDSEVIVMQTEKGDKVERPQDKSYTYGTADIYAHSHNKYLQWKHRQLMSDVLRTQIQAEAVQEAYQHRYEAFRGVSLYSNTVTAENSLVSAHTPPRGTMNTTHNIRNNNHNRNTVMTQHTMHTQRTSHTAHTLNTHSLHENSTITNINVIKTSRLHPHALPMLKLTLRKARYVPVENFTSITENEFYLQLNIGTCICRTHTIHPTPQGMRWDRLNASDRVPINDIQTDECILELLDAHPSSPDKTHIGRGHLSIDKSLGYNMSREVEFRTTLYTREKNLLGEVFFTIHVDVDEFASQHVADPKNLNFFEINRKISHTKRIEMGIDHSVTYHQHDNTLHTTSVESVEVNYPGSVVSENYCNLSSLVADLRGDGVDFIKLLTGDVNLQDLQKVGAEASAKFAQNLPNFKQATAFLEKKTNRHRWELDAIHADIEHFYTQLDDTLNKKHDLSNKNCIDKRIKLKKVLEQSEDLKKEVLKYQKTVTDSRKPHPEPKEPIFAELPPVPWVPKLPVSGGLDNRGKKKKALPNAELKSLCDAAESGALDGVEMWPMPENLFPSQAQLLKLGKAMTVRNAILDQKRKAEEEVRERLTEAYATEKERWELMEKRRLRELERNKKDCRKINLKFDSFMEIVGRTQREYEQLEADLSIVADLRSLHAKCKQRFKMARFKQTLEYQRQQKYLNSLKKRLLRALKARTHALSLPGTAMDDLTYAQLCRSSEAALRTLRYEIFETKQILHTEGLRLRTLFQEEYRLCLNELSRAKLSREIILQRDCYDRILERYKFEVVNLYSEMEKLRLRESESDDIGVETVNDLGERYRADKRWTSPEVVRCQKLIDICMAKINLTEGLGNSTGLSQKLILDVMTVKWGADFLPMRDSWTDHADFDRAQHLLEDTLHWAQTERIKLENVRKKNEADKIDLQLQLSALQHEQKVALVTHETETKTITSCSTDVISVMRDHLDEYRQESESKILELDKSIINLSRECQKVREELLAQEMVFEEKIKVLWAFIHTLQTAVQQLSARMEMVLEEKERIVIESKLVADRMRHHLRIERKHCSNLLFIIQSQRGTVKFLTDVIAKLTAESKVYVFQQLKEKSNLRKEIWEQIFAFTRLSTDVDALFEFFAARLANLAGARASLNNALAGNGAALVLAALCKSPRPMIRKFAARAMGGMGWDGFIETRILLWDSVMYWKMFKAQVIAKEAAEFKSGLDRFNETGKMEAIINMAGEVEEFVPSGNMSLRTIIKQRRQWALRAARRREGPNTANQRQLNVRDGVIPSLLEMSLQDGAVDWEISRNAALAISIASYEPSNHHEMTHNKLCIDMIISMCRGVDAEVQTHAAVTIANLCHKDENSQRIFGESGAIESLVQLCRSSVVDVLEAATSALANLTSYSDHNCMKVLENDGVNVMVNVVTHAYSENLLDLDQNDEVQANAAELLANVSRFSVDATVPYFSGKVIDALVVMCASQNKQLRRHIPLVLGNIGQLERCRQEIGVKGGIEALFLVLEDSDTTMQANTLWSLCNLMWHPPNQERAGRFMTEILEFMESPWAPVRIQAITLLANTLYYNGSNRVRFLEIDGAMELVLSFASNRPDIPLVEGALRALLSLSYVDAIAMWLGTTGGFIPMFIGYLATPYYSRDSMRYSLEILCNLCLHHDNRRIIYENGGVDAIVSLHIDTDPHVRDLSVKIIEYLEDITPAEVLARTRDDIGLERMVTLAASSDPLVRAVAAESIGEEIWRDPSKQTLAHKIGGVDVLLGIAANAQEPVESLLPALWSLRNLLHDQPAAKTQFGFRDGISIMNTVIRQGFTGRYAEQSEKIFEAVLACLTTAALHDERNSRRLLMVALPAVLDLADGKLTHVPIEPTDFAQSAASFGTQAGLSSTANNTVVSSRAQSQMLNGMRGEGVNSLARALLLQLAPYNYVVCKNCHKRQDLHGTTCFNCGYRLLVEPDITEIDLRKTFERQSSMLSQAINKSPHSKSKSSFYNLANTTTAQGPLGSGLGPGTMSTKSSHVGGLRRMAEERRQQDGVAVSGAPTLSPRLHATSSSKRLHSPQPLLASDTRPKQTSDTFQTGHIETKNQETSPSDKNNPTAEDSFLGSKTMPLPVRHPSAGRTRGGVNSAGISSNAAGAKERANANKLYISKSTAALDRALGTNEFLSSTSAKANTNKGADS